MTKKLNHLDLANYVVGWLVHGEPLTKEGAKQALEMALHLLDDEQDGIEAVSVRDPKCKCLTQQPELGWEAVTHEGVVHAYHSNTVLTPTHWRIIPSSEGTGVAIQDLSPAHSDWGWNYFEGPDALEKAKAYAREYPEIWSP
jgi:hypothetical protein